MSALTLIIAVNVWIQCSIANSEPSALSGRCQKTDEKEKSIGRRRDREIGRKENQNIWESGDKRHRNTGIRRLGDGIKRKSGNKRMRRRFGAGVDYRHETRTRSRYFYEEEIGR